MQVLLPSSATAQTGTGTASQSAGQTTTVSGRVIDKDGFAVPSASVSYRNHHIGVSTDLQGRFTIERHAGWMLTVSCVGMKTAYVKVGPMDNFIEVRLKDDSRALKEVVVKSKRKRYSRKDNPAVELMRRVIAAKKRNRLENHDYYRYDKYQKLTAAINDIKPEELETKFYQKRKYLLDQIETSPYNGKLTLPFSVDETVTERLYRKNPEKTRDIVKARTTSGISEIVQTGEIFTTGLKDVFTDVDIYDDHIRLLQYPFPSPIGRTAISFYHFYIEDTVKVDGDLCYHLQFTPANQQDFGFRGELFVTADSVLHVKKCNMYLPHKSDVNWVEDMKIEQEYTRLPNGEWVLTKDDMVAELEISDIITKGLVVRNTRYSNYSFDPIDSHDLRGRARVKNDADMLNRDETYWSKYRTVAMTRGEKGMKGFIKRMTQSKGWKWLLVGIKAFGENYVETGHDSIPSYFDFGPVNTYLSKNYVDGIRLRLAGRTTAALNPHLFWNGYAAYGTKSGRLYYGTELTYALNKKQHAAFEFPQRNITFESTYDVMAVSDRFLVHNKDNIFMTFRTKTPKEMYYYNRQKLSFNYETDWGLRYRMSVATESNRVAGKLHYYHLDGSEDEKFRKTELMGGITWDPCVTYLNTKQHRIPANSDSPSLSIQHTVGLKNFLGGSFRSNITEASVYKRLWLGSWGNIDFYADAQAQWNKVPFPMLLIPPVNLSYFEHENSFNMLTDWEFINDRQLWAALCWNMNGKILNRIPLIKKLKLREYVAVKGLWGHLTDKNNPFLARNAGDTELYRFPTEAHVMNNKPYIELVVGLKNIFKIFTVEYVRRMSYLDLDSHPKKWGIRFGFDMAF